MFSPAGIVTRLRRAVNDHSQPITAGLERGRWQLDHRDITLDKTLGQGQFGVVKAGMYKVRGRAGVAAGRVLRAG